MWLQLIATAEQGEKVKKYTTVILKLSAFLAIYGLFVIYKSTHDALHKDDKHTDASRDWRTTPKFISVKIVILLSMFQKMFVAIMVKKLRARDPTKTCLSVP